MKAEYDFSRAKRATEVPHLNKLREESQKTRITLYLDNDVVAEFKAKASEMGTGYQTEINSVLKQYINMGGLSFEALESLVRKIIKDEINQAKT